MEVFSLANTLEYALISLVLAGLFVVCSLKLTAILQQCGYKNKKTLKWYRRKDNMLFQRYLLLSLMLFLTSGLIGICFAFTGEAVAHRLALAPFAFFCPLFYYVDKKYALKVPIKETERLKRLALVHYFVLAVVIYILVAVINVIVYLADIELVSIWRYVPLSFLPLAVPFLLFVSNAADSVYENAQNKKYVTHAREKLLKSGAIKIGITGSFGKTSVKNILAAMLSEKYTVLSTPASYNTPMGIAKCVNEYTGEGYEVFIAEMGARNRGDIAELCALVEPQHSILTGVCGQHLESFGDVENVLATKSEILSGTAAGGTVVIGEDENTLKITPDGTRETVFIGDKNCVDIVCSKAGTEFSFAYDGRAFRLHTKLLGRHTARNIALAAALALKLGVCDEQIIAACEKLEYVPHRLEVISGGVTVIDDSYNANIKGVADAIETLKLFDGEKTVVTPGIVELGVLEEKVNGELGALLVGLDHVILVGDTLVGAVKNGYLEAGGAPERIQVLPTLDAARDALTSILHQGDTVLFLNDLPDVY